MSTSEKKRIESNKRNSLSFYLFVFFVFKIQSTHVFLLFLIILSFRLLSIMTFSNMTYVQLYFDSNGIANFQGRDSTNEIRYVMYPRKTKLSDVKQSLNEWIGNSSLPAIKIEKKCLSKIDPSYLIAILIGILFLLVLNILILSLARRRQRSVVGTQIVSKSNNALELEEKLSSEENIRRKRREIYDAEIEKIKKTLSQLRP